MKQSLGHVLLVLLLVAGVCLAQCNGRGTYSSADKRCQCNSGYAGNECNFDTATLTSGSTVTYTMTGYEGRVFNWHLPNTGPFSGTVTVTKSSGTCDNVRIAKATNCKKAGTSPTCYEGPKDTAGSGYNLDRDNSMQTSISGPTLDYDDMSPCECTKDTDDATYYLRINLPDTATNATTCTVTVLASATAECPSVCERHGKCVDGICKCQDGWVGLGCSVNGNNTVGSAVHKSLTSVTVTSGALSMVDIATSGTNTKLSVKFDTVSDRIKLFGAYGEQPKMTFTRRLLGDGTMRVEGTCSNCQISEMVKKDTKYESTDQKLFAKTMLYLGATVDGGSVSTTGLQTSLSVTPSFEDGLGSFVDILFLLVGAACAGYYYYTLKKNPDKMKELVARLKEMGTANVMVGEHEDRMEVVQLPLRAEYRYVVHTVDLLRYLQAYLTRNHRVLPSVLEVADREEPVPVDRILRNLHVMLDMNEAQLPPCVVDDFGLPALPVHQLVLQIIDTLERVADIPAVELNEESTHASEIIQDVLLGLSGLGNKLPPLSVPVMSLKSSLTQLQLMLADTDDQYVPTINLGPGGDEETGAGSSSSSSSSSASESLLKGDKSVSVLAAFEDLVKGCGQISDEDMPWMCLPLVKDKRDPTTFSSVLQSIKGSLLLMDKKVRVRSVCAMPGGDGKIDMLELVSLVQDAFSYAEYVPGIYVRDTLILKSDDEIAADEAAKEKRAKKEEEKQEKKEKEDKKKEAQEKAKEAQEKAGEAGGDLGVDVDIDMPSADVDLPDADLDMVDVDVSVDDAGAKKAAAEVGKGAMLAQTAVLSALGFIFRMLRAMLNVGVIHGTMTTVFPTVVPSVHDLRVALTSVFSGFGDMSAAFAGAFRNINIVPLILGWNCKGSSMFLSAVLMLVGTYVFVRALREDWLLQVAIRLNQMKQRESNAQKAKAFEKLSALVETAAFVVMQTFVLFLYSMMSSAWDTNAAYAAACSDIDAFAKQFALFVMIAGLAVAVGGNFFLFAGKATRPFEKYTGYQRMGALVAHGFLRIIMMTLGLWNAELVKSYNIKGRAYRLIEFDDDADESRHEAIISSTARSRSLFWILIPGAVVLQKVGETLSSPSPWASEELSFKMEKKVRLFKWASNLVHMFSTVLCALAPTATTASLLLLSLFPNWGFDLVVEVRGILGK